VQQRENESFRRSAPADVVSDCALRVVTHNAMRYSQDFD